MRTTIFVVLSTLACAYLRMNESSSKAAGIAAPAPSVTATVLVKPTQKTRASHAVSMTAYTSRVGECDATPFITADGTHVRDGIIAANFLPFGTKVRIPELFGDKIFEVHDRMNKRHTNRVDIWMESLADARKFGVRYATIEIVDEPTAMPRPPRTPSQQTNRSVPRKGR
jgi:3D (Asp-Asp-Asp) domain-containing protein